MTKDTKSNDAERKHQAQACHGCDRLQSNFLLGLQLLQQLTKHLDHSRAKHGQLSCDARIAPRKHQPLGGFLASCCKTEDDSSGRNCRGSLISEVETSSQVNTRNKRFGRDLKNSLIWFELAIRFYCVTLLHFRGFWLLSPCRKQGFAMTCSSTNRELCNAAGCKRTSEKHCKTIAAEDWGRCSMRNSWKSLSSKAGDCMGQWVKCSAALSSEATMLWWRLNILNPGPIELPSGPFLCHFLQLDVSEASHKIFPFTST